MVGPSETRKSQLIHHWLKIRTFQPEFDTIYYFHQHSWPLYEVMEKHIERFAFFQGVNYQNVDSVKNNGSNYLLIFDNSCEKIWNSISFVDTANAGRHRGLSFLYLKHNFFQQSKLGRDAELQKTPVVLFISPRDVMQISVLIAQFDLGSELVDWHREATWVW